MRYLGLAVGILILGVGFLALFSNSSSTHIISFGPSCFIAGAILIGGHMISSAIKERNKNE